MTKSSAHIATKKTRGTHRKTARKVGAVNAHSNRSQDGSQSCRPERRAKLSPRKRELHIARPQLNSINSLALRKCQSRCALSPKRA